MGTWVVIIGSGQTWADFWRLPSAGGATRVGILGHRRSSKRLQDLESERLDQLGGSSWMYWGSKAFSNVDHCVGPGMLGDQEPQ